MCQADIKMTNERANKFLQHVYEIYADYALKNPFYSLEMPIGAGELFIILPKVTEDSSIACFFHQNITGNKLFGVF